MIGAIIGDMVGSPYEFEVEQKTKDFGPLFGPRSHFTDDSVMTIAVADGLMTAGMSADLDTIRKAVIKSMKAWAKKYPHAGYGGMFSSWVMGKDSKPYNSWGNGSAMRVSSVGWLYPTLDRTLDVAKATAEVTHNHPEGIKGAQATAAAIFLARSGRTKEEIKQYIIDTFDYDLSLPLDEIRPYYTYEASCQGTVPEAITAFLEGTSFEDVVRNAVSLGGDCDTLTCIASGMAEAFYRIPQDIQIKCEARIPGEFVDIIDRFRRYIK